MAVRVKRPPAVPSPYSKPTAQDQLMALFYSKTESLLSTASRNSKCRLCDEFVSGPISHIRQMHLLGVHATFDCPICFKAVSLNLCIDHFRVKHADALLSPVKCGEIVAKALLATGDTPAQTQVPNPEPVDVQPSSPAPETPLPTPTRCLSWSEEMDETTPHVDILTDDPRTVTGHQERHEAVQAAVTPIPHPHRKAAISGLLAVREYANGLADAILEAEDHFTPPISDETSTDEMCRIFFNFGTLTGKVANLAELLANILQHDPKKTVADALHKAWDNGFYTNCPEHAAATSSQVQLAMMTSTASGLPTISPPVGQTHRIPTDGSLADIITAVNKLAKSVEALQKGESTPCPPMLQQQQTAVTTETPQGNQRTFAQTATAEAPSKKTVVLPTRPYKALLAKTTKKAPPAPQHTFCDRKILLCTETVVNPILVPPKIVKDLHQFLWTHCKANLSGGHFSLDSKTLSLDFPATTAVNTQEITCSVSDVYKTTFTVQPLCTEVFNLFIPNVCVCNYETQQIYTPAQLWDKVQQNYQFEPTVLAYPTRFAALADKLAEQEFCRVQVLLLMSRTDRIKQFIDTCVNAYIWMFGKKHCLEEGQSYFSYNINTCYRQLQYPYCNSTYTASAHKHTNQPQWARASILCNCKSILTIQQIANILQVTISQEAVEHCITQQVQASCFVAATLEPAHSFIQDQDKLMDNQNSDRELELSYITQQEEMLESVEYKTGPTNKHTKTNH
ncbi:uncharacterized protein FOMMEDRAFT_19010 [Fomitiporia mediterranea MF3/22]|uniref:uncharacterized protein n=1 Tax=Fomitiporia mediterranea (strain MF3/22) TaxID=694068 RepID=UPI0004407F90|nr:uncharacterized protein FOMMEDRAFT_19010 [Fomitiporia mediterranea MF3/22]EJD03609.1 hypothetical protein FOMMEDRAFT_19010 [Fomitiporia mediterranea MF3/22]